MRVTPSASSEYSGIITLTEAKAYLRVDTSAEDSLIGDCLLAATQQIEDMANTRLKSVTSAGYIDAFYTTRFPVGPIVSVGSVQYKKQGQPSTYTTLPTTQWYATVQGVEARISFVNPPALEPDCLDRVKINFDYGYDNSQHMRPRQFKQAILMLTLHYYDNRSPVSHTGKPVAVPMSVTSLVSTFRQL